MVAVRFASSLWNWTFFPCTSQRNPQIWTSSPYTMQSLPRIVVRFPQILTPLPNTVQPSPLMVPLCPYHIKHCASPMQSLPRTMQLNPRITQKLARTRQWAPGTVLCAFVTVWKLAFLFDSLIREDIQRITNRKSASETQKEISLSAKYNNKSILFFDSTLLL